MNEILTQINGIPILRNFVEHLPYNPHLKKIIKRKTPSRNPKRSSFLEPSSCKNIS
ncbi:hypothetical protein [Epilithonimonas xixisoli]|uniref:hypothetical protein n=1 Tax=Epilithonimonas xixisoli TaxID=1476462 RepID=UPI001C87A423|nr:hypothetical protein [Epilithonimonas xixisoli]